jgi:hypothetical protein
VRPNLKAHDTSRQLARPGDSEKKSTKDSEIVLARRT